MGNETIFDQHESLAKRNSSFQGTTGGRKISSVLEDAETIVEEKMVHSDKTSQLPVRWKMAI